MSIRETIDLQADVTASLRRVGSTLASINARLCAIGETTSEKSAPPPPPPGYINHICADEAVQLRLVRDIESKMEALIAALNFPDESIGTEVALPPRAPFIPSPPDMSTYLENGLKDALAGDARRG